MHTDLEVGWGENCEPSNLIKCFVYLFTQSFSNYQEQTTYEFCGMQKKPTIGFSSHHHMLLLTYPYALCSLLWLVILGFSNGLLKEMTLFSSNVVAFTF